MLQETADIGRLATIEIKVGVGLGGELLDHLVGAGDETVGEHYSQGASRSEIDDEIKFCRLLDWQVPGLFSFQDAIDIGRCPAEVGGHVRPVADEPTIVRVFTFRKDAGQARRCRPIENNPTLVPQHCVWHHDERSFELIDTQSA